jgi:hypothetical protein
LRAELAQEVVAMQKVQAAHGSRVVLDIGGVRPTVRLPKVFKGTFFMYRFSLGAASRVK